MLVLTLVPAALLPAGGAHLASSGLRPRSQPAHCFFPAPVVEGVPFCNGLPGANAPILGGKFDPFGFTVGKDALEINRLREAELVHCRVGMLATAGFIVQEFYHPLFDGKGGTAAELITRIPLPMWFTITLVCGFCEVRRLQAGWVNPDAAPPPVTAAAAAEVPPPAPVVMEAAVAEEGAADDAAPEGEAAPEVAEEPVLVVAEAATVQLPVEGSGAGLPWWLPDQRLREGYEPGNLGFDPWGIKPEDPTEYKKVQEAEITNGRLAMLAAAGFLMQEAMTGQTWGAYWGL